MRRILGPALVLAVLGVALWLLLRAGGAPASPEPDSRGADPSVQAQAELAGPDPLASERATAAPVVAPAPPEPDGLAEIFGRFLLPGGAPANGVAVELEGRVSNDELVRRYGTPKDWKNPAAKSGEDGRFSIRLDPPRAFQFWLRASLDGWARETWRFSGLPRGETKDLGDITLTSGGTILGKLSDASGRPLGPGWSADARGGGGDGRDHENAWERREVDPATGEFTIEHMSPGMAKLAAFSSLSQQVDGPTVEVREGEITEARIVYSGPDLSRRILVFVSARPFFVAGPDIEQVLLRGPGIEPRKAVKNPRSSMGYVLDEVPPGSYTLEVRDARFRPWSQDGVEPGTRVVARLEGSAAVQLTVVEGYTGAPVPAYRLLARNARQVLGSYLELLHAGEAPPPGGLFEKIVPQDLEVLLLAEGFAECALAAPGLQPGEVRPLVARLSRGAGIAGRVVESGTNRPMPRVAVHLRRWSEPQPGAPPPSMTWLQDNDLAFRDTETGADGSFAFGGIPEGRYLVRAILTPIVKSQAEDVTVADDEQRDGVALALPATARLKGRLTGPKEARFVGLRLLVAPAVEERIQRFALSSLQMMDESRPTIGTRVAEDGSFATGPLPPGSARVGLRVPMAWLPGAAFASANEPLDLGPVDLPPGEVVERDFDVSASFPAFVDVRVSVNGAPAPGLVVEARNAARPVEDVGGGVAGGDGVARVGPLAPAEYRFLVRPSDSSWTFLAPGSVTVQCGVEPAFSVEVTLVEGTLRFVDQTTGAPLASTRIAGLVDGEAGPPSFWIRTDAGGAASLRLPIGRYFAWRQDDIGQAQTGLRGSLDWTAAGPVPAVVSLRKPD